MPRGRGSRPTASPATTVAGIAVEAGVSTATIYKVFGGKPGLVRALVERALRGDPAQPDRGRGPIRRPTRGTRPAGGS